MSEPTPPRRALHLVIEGFPIAQVQELTQSSPDTEIFPLTETNAREALEKIFTADTIAVWSNL